MEITLTAVLLVLALGKHIARYPPYILQAVDPGEANLLEASRENCRALWLLSKIVQLSQQKYIKDVWGSGIRGNFNAGSI